ncbi:MAG: Rho termination factor N-terminal domain-containing protein [Ruminococcus sp.]|nr:Rho termination factor N-terminal domain-containing protein [Ruminococcus sp.]
MGKVVGLNFAEDTYTPDICIEDMTVTQLKEFAKYNGIDIGSASKKSDIIDAIIAAGDTESEV